MRRMPVVRGLTEGARSAHTWDQLFSDDWISGEFGALFQWYQEAMYPDGKLWRGRSLDFHRAPRVPTQAPRSYCTQAGLWSRVESMPLRKKGSKLELRRAARRSMATNL